MRHLQEIAVIITTTFISYVESIKWQCQTNVLENSDKKTAKEPWEDSHMKGGSSEILN